MSENVFFKVLLTFVTQNRQLKIEAICLKSDLLVLNKKDRKINVNKRLRGCVNFESEFRFRRFSRIKTNKKN